MDNKYMEQYREKKVRPGCLFACIGIAVIFILVAGVGIIKFHTEIGSIVSFFKKPSTTIQTGKVTLAPSFSLNGSLYFVEDNNLWNISGSNITQVTTRHTINQISVTQDGKFAVYSTIGYNSSDLYLLNLTSRQTKKLTNNSSSSILYNNLWNVDPTFTPDGNTIAYLSDRGKFASGVSDLGVYQMNLATLAPVDLTQGNPYTGGDQDPTYYPLDSTYILYDKYIYLENQPQPFSKLFLLNTQTRVSYAITPDLSGDFEPAFSDDGKYIVFAQRDYSANQATENVDLYMMPFNLSNVASTDPSEAFLADYQQKVLIHTGLDAMPVFSPDNSQVAFMTESDNNFDLAAITIQYKTAADGTVTIIPGKVRMITTNSDISTTSRLTWIAM